MHTFPKKKFYLKKRIISLLGEFCRIHYCGWKRATRRLVRCKACHLCMCNINNIVHSSRRKTDLQKVKTKVVRSKNDFLPVTKNVRGGKLGH